MRTRRKSIIAFIFIAMMLIVSSAVYATDEESATEETVIVEEPTDETEKEEVITEEQSAEDTEIILREDLPEEKEGISAGDADIEVQEETQDPAVSAPAPQPSIPEPPAKSAIDNAVDRVRTGGRSVDLSDLKIPEGEMDALMTAIVNAGLVPANAEISFISEGGYITSYEVDLDLNDDSKPSSPPKDDELTTQNEAQDQIQTEERTVAESVHLVPQQTAHKTEIPEEGSAEQPVSGLLGFLALITSGIRHALNALH